MGRIIKLLMIVVFMGFIAYGGMCVYGNFFAPGEGIEMPNESKASYLIVFKNTATVILADEYEVFGNEVGSRTYVLQSYWELVGSEFQYRVKEIALSEQVFGEIVVKRR